MKKKSDDDGCNTIRLQESLAAQGRVILTLVYNSFNVREISVRYLLGLTENVAANILDIANTCDEQVQLRLFPRLRRLRVFSDPFGFSPPVFPNKTLQHIGPLVLLCFA